MSDTLEYSRVASESNADGIPAARLVRWAALALLIIAGVLLYFRDGLHLTPFGGIPAP